ncbi:MAG: alpha/beta hydrolase [Thiotrichales bacterium]|nr:alpha/beta hydrolase [Thiotrichales bacterium]
MHQILFFHWRLALLSFFAFLSLHSVAFANYSSPTQVLSSSPVKYHVLAGTDSAKPAVFILGGGPAFSSWNLEPIQQQIHQLGHTVYLMDMLGIGENRALLQPETPLLSQWVEQLETLRRNTHPNQSVTLVAHSWGALMAMLYQRTYPDAVNKVILLNPVDPEKRAMSQLTETIDKRNRSLQETAWDDESAWEQKTQIDVEDIPRITLRQIQQVLPTYFLDYEKGKAYAEQFGTDDFNIDLNVQAWAEYDANPIGFDEIRQWPASYYFLECNQDYLMPFNLNAMRPQMSFKKVALIDQCGHFPWIEQPQAFNQYLSEFLRD